MENQSRIPSPKGKVANDEVYKNLLNYKQAKLYKNIKDIFQETKIVFKNYDNTAKQIFKEDSLRALRKTAIALKKAYAEPNPVLKVEKLIKLEKRIKKNMFHFDLMNDVESFQKVSYIKIMATLSDMLDQTTKWHEKTILTKVKNTNFEKEFNDGKYSKIKKEAFYEIKNTLEKNSKSN